MTDASYDSTADIASGEQLIIESDEAIYGLYIIWSSEVSGYTISYNDKDNNKTSIQCGSYGYLHDYIPFNTAATSITIETSADMSISDIYAYSEGRLPETVQIWQPPCNDDTDILVFSTHADDEILFLGGVLTNYGGEQGLNVQVAYMCDFFLTEPVRQHEELDGLWECGIKNYPVKGDFMDLYSLDLGTAMTQYNYDDIVSYATACVRRFNLLSVYHRISTANMDMEVTVYMQKLFQRPLTAQQRLHLTQIQLQNMEYGIRQKLITTYITKTLSLLMLIHLLAGSTKERLLIY